MKANFCIHSDVPTELITREALLIWKENWHSIKPEKMLIFKKHLLVKLVYYEKYQRIDEVFYREKQVQGWSRAKKEALING
ncbi:MAG TPA: hypothetical protein PKK66_07235, partial [Bacteroidales bacterium]|nr:hypothetical protein [Bacteroidales bacterium]